jgi:regulator of sigma E protease
MNLITAVIIFAILFVVHGVPENSNIVGYVEQNSLAYTMGVIPGDEFVKVNGKEKSKLEEFMVPLYTEKNVSLTVRRDGVEKTLTSSRMLGQKEDFGIMPFYDAKVGTVISGGPAGSAGLKPGDIIKAVGEQPVNGWYQMSKIIKACPDSLIVFKILRSGQEINIPIKTNREYETTPDGKKVAVGKIGVTLEFPRKKVGFIEASAIAFDKTVFICKEMLDFLWKLITGRMSSKLLGGPIMIAQLAGESAKSGFSTLMSLTAFISINLGILNLFPLPALDGGHILIILIESVIRRKISLKIKMAIQQIGILLFLFLMIYVTFNDVMRLDSITKFFGK